jgi:hypothetical protein
LGACKTCTWIKSYQEGFKKNSLEWNNLRKELVNYLSGVLTI